MYSKVTTANTGNKKIIGWNKHVGEAHREARVCFQNWVLFGKPTTGHIFNLMCHSRKVFKSRLRWVQNHQDQVKMDILASHHRKNDFRNFWKCTKKMETKTSLSVNINGTFDAKGIANLFKDHFNCKSSVGGSDGLPVFDGGVRNDPHLRFSSKDINKIIRDMKRGKSPGHDYLSIEHLQFAGPHLPRLLSMFFNLCIGHSYLPSHMTKTVVVPIIKNKTGDISDITNYRPISLATIVARVLDSILSKQLDKCLQLHDGQFGFRAGLSTESAIICLKNTVEYYTRRRTPIYACFLDLSKAFDLVNYNLLWKKLDDAKFPRELTRIFRYWYASQRNSVRWGNILSDEYGLDCGVRQGGLTSPKLFNLYVNELIGGLSSTHVGCHINRVCHNNISYADDMVLLSPSVGGLRILIDKCESYALSHNLKYNVRKSEYMVFKAGNKCPSHVPPIRLNGEELNRVHIFKYLGHIVTDDLRDDADIERERRALAVRANMIARRFGRCTAQVKITLFRAYCTSLYTGSLWSKYTQRAMNALRVQYNDAFRVLLRLPRYCSASGMFADAHVDGFHATLRKRCAATLCRVRGSRHSLLTVVADRWDSNLVKHWSSHHLSCRHRTNIFI
jgi:hypothetical protein